MDIAKKISGIYIAFILQSLLLENIKIFSCSPDLILACVIIFAVSQDFITASIMGAFAGLLKDALYARVFGMNILIYMYLAILVSISVDKKNDNSPLIMSWILFVCTASFEIALTLFKYMLGYASSMGYLGTNIMVKGLFCAIFAFLYVLARQNIKRRRENKNSSQKEEIA